MPLARGLASRKRATGAEATPVLVAEVVIPPYPPFPAATRPFRRSSRPKVCTEAMAQLTDATDYDVRRSVAAIARQVPGVVSFDRVRARRMGPKTLVDLTIQTEDKISASAAQQVRPASRGLPPALFPGPSRWKRSSLGVMGVVSRSSGGSAAMGESATSQSGAA